MVGRLVGCFWLNVSLRQYFSLCPAVSQREKARKKREIIDERKMSKQPPPAPAASAVGPCPTIIQISKTPRHRKFIQHHRTIRPPQTEREREREMMMMVMMMMMI